VTKAEVTKNTFAHHSFDAVVHGRPLLSDERIQTEATLIGIGSRKSGGHFVSRFRHTDEAGAVVCTSWWGGILIGYQAEQGSADRYLEGEQCPPPPQITAVPQQEEVAHMSQTLHVSPAHAHIWDACIRDPRNAKAASSDINVHTNMAFAEKAGSRGRTLNGLCLLGIAMTNILSMTSVAESWEGLKRVGCVFGAAVILRFEQVALEVCITGRGPNAEGDEVILFDVITSEGKQAIRGGYVVVDASFVSNWWGSSRM
jgi:acyl dehydratase